LLYRKQKKETPIERKNSQDIMEVKVLKKLQQFFIFKFDSSRLKKENYDIEISFDQASVNGEVITINNSELVRTYFRHKDIIFDQNEVDGLLSLQKKLRNHQNSKENREKLVEIDKKLVEILFIEDFISVEFKNKSHYRAILNRNGFYINGIRFTPFMASAGMIRRNTALFVNNNIKHPLMDILENDRNPNCPLVPAKWGAYFSLYSSSTLPVSFPKFAVIPDKELEILTRVDFVEYVDVGIDDTVTEKDYLLKTNAWDGQGLITPKLAKKWSKELELDYTFSCAVIRAPFTKGLVAVFDFHDFATNVAKKYSFTDIYGEEKDIRNYDLIISESMFKLWDAYNNTEDFISKCKKNKLGFSVAKVNLEKEKTYSRTSYQFLQILNLNDADIAELCEPTISWFRDMSGGNILNMLLYATGEDKFKPEDFSKMDISVQALLINPELAKDKYIRKKFLKSIAKKRKESYMGKLFINANYQFMVSDPYYQACHLLGIKDDPLLKENEHYSEYWLERGIKQVAAIRSPIVHHSELNILNFKEDKETKKWFKHIHSGIIFPANGIGMDCAIHGGADFDGDLICTINNDTIKKGKMEGIPIVYESQKAGKEIVDSRDDEIQVKSQLNGHNSKVGFATNISSSLYTLLEEFPKGSKERETILKRLKIGRVIQGEIIDSVKGLKVPPFRYHWTRYQKITDDMTAEEKERTRFNNKIVCEVRPAFFRYLYPHYMGKYRNELKQYNIYSHLAFGKPFSKLWKQENKTREEEELLERYKNRSYFLNNDSVVNRISRHMRMNSSWISRYSSKISEDYDYEILIDKDILFTDGGLFQMEVYLREYKNFKKGLRSDENLSYDTLEAFIKYLRKQCHIDISSNDSELANYAVRLTYGKEISMVEFPWQMFPQGVLQNIIKNSTGNVNFPVPQEDGEILYLWDRYTVKEYPLEELYEN
jgi:hypothetical protein